MPEQRSSAAEIRRVVRALYSAISPPSAGVLTRNEHWAKVMDLNARTDWRNAVLHSEVDGETADAVIAEEIEKHRALGLPLSWYVSPLTRPLEFSQRLLANGFIQAEVMLGMSAPLDRLHAPEVSDAITVEIVTPDTLSELFTVHRIGWGTPEDIVRARESDAREMIEAEQLIKSRFIARVAGKPVGISTLRFDGDTAHFCGSVVLPEYRNRGVYSALFDARVRHGQDRAMSHATVHANPNTSAPICRKFGFEDVCEIECYSLEM
jgi:GNAT superfamily N-acetyltransferase